jgi:3-hydroxymyristoyl/3-hydroxydecanoyl-(acyl carrier protein) dehydratase
VSRAAPEQLASRAEAGALELTLRVPVGHACFAGHFPSDPIVPGIAQLDWAVSELGRWLARDLEVVTLEALKFRRPIRPGATFVLRLARGREPSAYAFELRDDDGPISSGRVRVRA